MVNHSSSSELRETAHELIYEVNTIAPSLLLYVLPNLENELTVDSDEARPKAVVLLSRMFAATGSTLHTSYRQLFTSFLSRFNDKSDQIRKEMLEFAHHFLATHSDLASEVLGLCYLYFATLKLFKMQWRLDCSIQTMVFASVL